MDVIPPRGIIIDGIFFAYDYYNDGMRISKTVSDTVSDETTSNTSVCVYNDGLLINETSDKDSITYYYDGEVIEIGYQVKSGNTFGDETRYFFSRNAQSDIVAIYRSKDSVLMGTYDYDLWGNITVVGAASGMLH